MSTFNLAAALPRGTVLLEASAGTGKTHTIAALATRYLAEGVVRADQLAVITFSRMASQELRQRVRQRLQSTVGELARVAAGELLSGTADEADGVLASGARSDVLARQGRLTEALTGFDDAAIMTIHEYCQSALHRLGILAAQDPRATLVEDLGPLRRDIVEDLYLARYASVDQAPFGFAEAEEIAACAAGTPDAPLVPDLGGGRIAERLAFGRAVRDELVRRTRRLGVFSFDDQLLRLHDSLLGEGGELARRRLRAAHRVVLVDEFQDTDPVQWRILRSVFHGHATLVLIGDPKQAIYTFRGADVAAYADAVREADARFGLTVNHRSDAAVVRALDVLFEGVSLGPGIAVGPVTAAHRQSRLAPSAGSPWRAPVRIRTVAGAGTLRVGQARQTITDDLVAEVRSLLADQSCTVIEPGGPRPLRAGDIAVLVRTNSRGRQIATRLAESGITVAFGGADSIFTSEASTAWQTLLRALDQPRRTHVRAAVLTDFVGGSLAELAAADDDQLSDWAALIHQWAQVLRGRGVAALFAAISSDGSFVSRVLSCQRGERALTDYRHVAQLLHQAEAAGTRSGSLSDWLDSAISAGESTGERTRRLETDGHAVQIMTVHKAKGLQFPIVLLPEASDQHTSEDDGRGLVLHEESGARVLDVGGQAAPGRPERFRAASEESAADGLRTLYVAATRAQCQLTMWWARTGQNTASSPLHRMLFRRRDGSIPEISYRVDRPPGDGDPAALPWLEGSGIVVEPIDVHASAPALARSAAGPDELAMTPWRRRIDRTWRRTSYSGLTAAAHAQPTLPNPSATTVVDDEFPHPAEPEPEASGPRSPMAALPAGPAFGTLVHHVLESVDWYAPRPTAEPELRGRLAATVSDALRKVRLPEVEGAPLADALLPTLLTPLGVLTQGRCLSEIPVSDRLAELTFEFPLGHPPTGATLGQIGRLLTRHLPDDDPLAGYPRLLENADLDDQPLRGFLTGSVDAVLRVGFPGAPRFVVVDYKTNRLTDVADLRLGHYTLPAMTEEMLRCHYPLQALLYSVALHRFLLARLPGYRPSDHLGGVLYLFVRGMGGRAAEVTVGTGVFSWEPPSPLIVELSALLGGGRSG